MFDWHLVIHRRIDFKTGKPFPRDKVYWDVTATKTASYPVPPVPGAFVEVGKWRSFKIEEVRINEKGYAVTLELLEKFKSDYSDKDKNAFDRLDWYKSREIELLSEVIGERESDLRDDDWWLTVKELGSILSKKSWEITCYESPVLRAAS